MNALTFQALRQLADGRFHSGEAIARGLGRSRATLSEALKHAPALGLELFSVPGKGYKLAEPIEFLDASVVAAAMGSSASRVRLEIADEVDSTSSRLLARAAAGEAPGACLAAEWQSAGRGRRGRGWVGGLGGSILFSLLWRFERGVGQLAGLSLAAGLAVTRALRECGVERAQVKWPNDIVADFRKIGGILIESSGEMHGPSIAVIGIGLNYRLGDRLGEIDQPAVDIVGASAGGARSRNEVLASVLSHLVRVLDDFEREGFTPLRDEWRSLHAYEGRRVRVAPPNETAYEADVTGVGEDGALLVTAQGRVVRLASAELTAIRPAAR
ncbi:biotin--[acetyl-CoA-carboxylase] ligase [Betaproteobacteria bacterium GR16-43]|nr:biotin--[acetyl-CoA-carboxylase] ligase [Betaproteobacteria bacterium GR16-43]